MWGVGWGFLCPFLSPADKNGAMRADAQTAILDHKEEANAEAGRATRRKCTVMHTPAYM